MSKDKNNKKDEKNDKNDKNDKKDKKNKNSKNSKKDKKKISKKFRCNNAPFFKRICKTKKSKLCKCLFKIKNGLDYS